MVANASTASNATPTEVSLVGSPTSPFTLANFYPDDMILDEVNNILYVESENSNLVGGGIDRRHPTSSSSTRRAPSRR